MRYLGDKENKEEYDMCQALREWIEEERENGIVEGKVVGKAEGKAESILYLLEEKGEMSEKFRMTITQQKDEEVLRKWLLAAAKASTIEEFAAEM